MRRISLKFTLNDEVGYLSQPFRQSPEALQGVICLTPQLLGQLTCPANPQDAYVGRLVIIGVLPSGFTQRGCSGFRVEHVRDDKPICRLETIVRNANGQTCVVGTATTYTMPLLQ